MDPPEHMDTQTGLDTQLSASKHTHIQLFLEQHHDTAVRPVSSINTRSKETKDCIITVINQTSFIIIISHEVRR